MKKYIILFLFICLGMVIATSCLKEYLDKSPQSGLSEDVVFTKLANFKLFFDYVYNSPSNVTGGNLNIKNGYYLYFDFTDWKITIEGMTDLVDGTRIESGGQTFKAGNCGAINSLTWTTSAYKRPILAGMFKSIRKCNMAIKNINRLTDATDNDKNDLLAQAHFVRAFAHFELVRWWGGMPYITKVIGPDDQWDIPRLSRFESYKNVALDMDSAVTYFAKAGLMRRDPIPGQVGHLNSTDQFRPNGCTAKAYKARALLYAASPLNNDIGQSAWADAAIASWEAIQIAKQYSYDLLTAANYKQNFVGATYTNEQLWGWNAGPETYTSRDLQSLLNGVFAASTDVNEDNCPTQNAIDMFETKWGESLGGLWSADPVSDRAAAVAAGHYKDQDPYANRDPRFYIDVIYNTAPVVGFGTAQIYRQIVNGVNVYSQLLNYATYNRGTTYTGYYQAKLWGGMSVNNKTTVNYTCSLMRLGELYLDYAEAANEAYGPNTAAPGATMTAVDAINLIRNRIGMPNVLAQYTVSKEVFRSRIKNERTVELIYEGQYYHDIRRWKDAPKAYKGPIMGMDIQKVAVSSTYPTGYIYSRVPLPNDRQSQWLSNDAMYFLPFDSFDNYKMKNFVTNVVW